MVILTMAMLVITRWHTDHNRDVCWPASWSVDESDCNDGNDGEWIGGIIIPGAIHMTTAAIATKHRDGEYGKHSEVSATGY